MVTCSGSQPRRSTMMFLKSSKLIFWLSKYRPPGPASRSRLTLTAPPVGSLSQPLFGWLADRFGTRFTGLALAWTALTFSTLGFAPSFPALVAMAAAAGLGSGAFHPFGALNVG